MKKIIIILGLVFIAGRFACAQSAEDVNLPKNEVTNVTLMRDAWQAYSQQDYDKAMSSADKCIAIFDLRAKKDQASLTQAIPPDKINDYWALNDVATAKFIKGKIYMNTGKLELAQNVFTDIVENYSYAMAWDPRGWYWNVAEGAKNMLDAMRIGVDYGDASSAYLTVKAWNQLRENNYNLAVIYADRCIELYKEQALKQQESLKALPKKKDAAKYWALNDVGTCYYIAGLSYLRQKELEKSKMYFNFVRDNLSYAQSWDNRGWYWRISEAVNKELNSN